MVHYPDCFQKNSQAVFAELGFFVRLMLSSWEMIFGRRYDDDDDDEVMLNVLRCQ